MLTKLIRSSSACFRYIDSIILVATLYFDLKVGPGMPERYNAMMSSGI